MYQQLPLAAKIFCLLTLSNPMFICYMYILAMVTSLFLDFTVHFGNFITLEDGWLVGKYHQNISFLINFSK